MSYHFENIYHFIPILFVNSSRVTFFHMLGDLPLKVEAPKAKLALELLAGVAL